MIIYYVLAIMKVVWVKMKRKMNLSIILCFIEFSSWKRRVYDLGYYRNPRQIYIFT